MEGRISGYLGGAAGFGEHLHKLIEVRPMRVREVQ
jgi:hypothetical protein